MLTETTSQNRTWCTRTVCHCVLFASADVYQSWFYLHQSIESKVSGWSWHSSFKQSRIRNHGLSKHWIWNLWSITVTVPAHKKVDQVESVGTWEGGSVSPCPSCTKFTNSYFDKDIIKTGILQHLRTTHTDKQYVCTMCDFTIKSGSRQHMVSYIHRYWNQVIAVKFSITLNEPWSWGATNKIDRLQCASF